MVSSENIIDVSEIDFQNQVIQYSQHTPVVVDFWAEWCQPCQVLGPRLEKMANDAGGDFRLAKVDVDHNPNLAIKYNVRSIPNVKAIFKGELVSEFNGVIPEYQLRTFLQQLTPSPIDLLLDKANSLLNKLDWSGAEESYREVLNGGNNTSRVLLGFAKSLLAQGKASEAFDILNDFPASKEFSTAEILKSLAETLLDEDKNPLDADEGPEPTYKRAIFLIKKGNFPAAMDGLLEVLRKEKNYRDGKVRTTLLALFEILGNDSPLTRQYRSELASILF